MQAAAKGEAGKGPVDRFNAVCRCQARRRRGKARLVELHVIGPFGGQALELGPHDLHERIDDISSVAARRGGESGERHRSGQGDLEVPPWREALQGTELGRDAKAVRGGDLTFNGKMRGHVVAGHAEFALRCDAFQSLEMLEHLEDKALAVQLAAADDVQPRLDLVGDRKARRILEHLLDIGGTKVTLAHAGAARHQPAGRGIAADPHGRQQGQGLHRVHLSPSSSACACSGQKRMSSAR